MSILILLFLSVCILTSSIFLPIPIRSLYSCFLPALRSIFLHPVVLCFILSLARFFTSLSHCSLLHFTSFFFPQTIQVTLFLLCSKSSPFPSSSFSFLFHPSSSPRLSFRFIHPLLSPRSEVYSPMVSTQMKVVTVFLRIAELQ